MMNVKKGWPLAHPFEHSAKPKIGEAIVAGMAVKRDANGELVKADGTVLEVSFMALDDQAAYDVVEADRLPFAIGNMIVMTDQYAAGVYAPGDSVVVDSGNPGMLKVGPGGAGEPTWGWVDSLETIEGVAMLSIIKPAPFGEAQ